MSMTCHIKNRILNFFQPVTVMNLDLPPYHVVLVVIVPVKQDIQDKNVIAFQAIICLELTVLVRLFLIFNI